MGKVLTAIATGLFFVLKIIFWILKFIVTILGEIIVFFGLYVPIVYAILGAILARFTTFSLTEPSTDLNLFFLGLGLCGVCAIIITIRNFVIRPFKTVFGKFAKRRKDQLSSVPKMKKKEKDQPRRKDDITNDSDLVVEPTNTKRKKGKEALDESEKPLIYRSRVHPEITVYEYSDRFDLYRDSDDDELGKKFVKTEYK